MVSESNEPLPNDPSASGGQYPRAPWTKFYPRDVDWNAPLKGSTLPSLMDKTVAAFPSQIATNFLGKELTYGEVGKLVDRVAAGLQKLGVGKGVNVGLLLPNSPTFVIFYFGILKAGGTVVNFNPLYSVEELVHQTRDSCIQLMVTLNLRALFPKVEALLKEGGLPRAIVCSFTELLPSIKATAFRLLKRKELVAWESSDVRGKIVSYRKLIDNNGEPRPIPIDPDNDVAVLQYTGGTTGIPKGAMLTHSNLTINVDQLLLWAPGLVHGEERMMGILPFFHVFGMTVVMNFSISMGATMILIPKFELASGLKIIRKTKPTLMPGVPTLYNALMNAQSLRPGDLSSLKFCFSGGAPLPLEIKRGFEKVSGCALVEGYGLSETSPVATANPLKGENKEGSIGVPMPGTRLSLRSLEDPAREVPFGENGEIAITGPQVMKGYWQRPKETADAFCCNEGKDEQFFRTGDVAYMDSDGYTFIVDRIKDIIICSGFNVYPRRIEEAIYEFGPVEEVTVLGVPDAYRGEAPKAYVKLRPGAEVKKEELFKFLEPKLSKIEMPTEIEFRDTLPKTMIGKLSKKELRTELRNHARKA
jgi:long-chain acyl-CoA synthetase